MFPETYKNFWMFVATGGRDCRTAYKVSSEAQLIVSVYR